MDLKQGAAYGNGGKDCGVNIILAQGRLERHGGVTDPWPLPMRKIFSDRARIVVYLEQAEVPVMVAKAREEGKTLVEWAREVLRGEISQDVRGVPGVRVEKRGARRNGGTLG